ncbi:MAG: cytochrome c biogenesis protein CcdA [Actinomycetota bacterium]|nr:cytochrome c biogenesis protein CcdA [Actinomycetota bacterium]
MDSGIFFGGSVVAAVVAGAVALFAPCCVSVMLPAYLASSFQNRRVLVAMTFVFAAGVATVILPIALGAQIMRRLFTAEHTPVYVIGGSFMLGLGVYVLLGGQIKLPMPGRRTGGRAGVPAVYSLGLFSGVASTCCAPVLAGVIALSGVASSFGLALALGVAYVVGMVTPLFAIALLWERRDWRSSGLFHARSFTLRLGRFRRTVSGTNLASGALLIAMSVLTLWVAVAGSAMPSPGGWSATLSAQLQHYGALTTKALTWMPGWVVALLLVGGIALLVRRARRSFELDPTDVQEEGTTTKEEDLEHEESR